MQGGSKYDARNRANEMLDHLNDGLPLITYTNNTPQLTGNCLELPQAARDRQGHKLNERQAPFTARGVRLAPAANCPTISARQSSPMPVHAATVLSFLECQAIAMWKCPFPIHQEHRVATNR